MRDLKELTDLEVIELVLTEDSNYFEEIVDRYKNLVFSVVSRMVNDRDDVKDLSQEIFLKAYKNLAKYSAEFKFSTWIMRISTNHVIDFRRKKRLAQVPLDEVSYDIEDKQTPLTELIEKEKTQKINAVLEELPEMYREPIILYHEKGLSYQEISEQIDEPLSKVKNRIFRGRKLLKNKIMSSDEREVYDMKMIVDAE